MLFNSFVFPVFFLSVWALYLCLKHRPQNLMLLVASYVFYGWWDWRFLGLLFISTVTDYFIALAMGRCDEHKPRTRKALLIFSLATNLGILGFFKYFNFFADSVERVLAPLGLQPDFITLNILLPVGISFYTFQTMAYTIDVYRGKETPCRNFFDFALYVAYFPQLVAGPIERSTNLIPRIQNKRTVTWPMIASATQLILMGYFKKIFLADGVAPIVNECFDAPNSYGGVTLFLALFLFVLQIYGDFSGYTDIARGVSRMFGIDLMLNFRQPLLASSFTEFLQRWHISLQTWLRDYLYQPLMYTLMDRTGLRLSCLFISLIITMLLSGLWHGAAWKFVVWGGIYAMVLCVEAVYVNYGWKKRICRLVPLAFVRYLFGVCWVLLFFSLSGAFFRGTSCMMACRYLARVFSGGWAGYEIPLLYCLFYGACIFAVDIICYVQDSEIPFTEKWWSPFRAFGFACMLFLIIFIGESDMQPFIYFQF